LSRFVDQLRHPLELFVRELRAFRADQRFDDLFGRPLEKGVE
jgi:hypothetical protein